MEKDFEFRDKMQKRTKEFALRIIKLCQALPKSFGADVIGKQLFKSGTSVGANYRASCRARSTKEFYSKISIVIEEADESMFWMEMLMESGIVKVELLQDLYLENEEILKVFVKTRQSIKL